MLTALRTQIKICCMSSLEEVQLAIKTGVDAVGFVGGIPASPRAIDIQKVAALISHVPSHTATFLLTSESTAAGIARQIVAAGASTVQIASYLSPDEYDKLPSLLPMTQRVQVIHVENESALELIDQYAQYVHAFLLDSGRPSLPIPEYGGTGRTHDWSVSSEFVKRSPHPVFLAGGLSSGNVGEAIKVVRPFGVDLCSGVRTGGCLDRDKLKAYVNAVRQADVELDIC